MNTPIKAEELDELKVQIHENICKRMTDTYRRKNSDYGDSFSKLRAEFDNAILIRIADKYNRLKSLKSGKIQQVSDESIKDTLLDLANYCIMELVETEIGERLIEAERTCEKNVTE